MEKLNASCAITGRHQLAVAEFVEIAQAYTALFLLLLLIGGGKLFRFDSYYLIGIDYCATHFL